MNYSDPRLLCRTALSWYIVSPWKQKATTVAFNYQCGLQAYMANHWSPTVIINCQSSGHYLDRCWSLSVEIDSHRPRHDWLMKNIKSFSLWEKIWQQNLCFQNISGESGYWFFFEITFFFLFNFFWGGHIWLCSGPHGFVVRDHSWWGSGDWTQCWPYVRQVPYLLYYPAGLYCWEKVEWERWLWDR